MKTETKRPVISKYLPNLPTAETTELLKHSPKIGAIQLLVPSSYVTHSIRKSQHSTQEHSNANALGQHIPK